MAQGTKAIETKVDITDNSLTITTNKGEIIVTLATLSNDMLNHAALHGLKQKIVDAAAGLTTITEKHEAMESVLGRIREGEWNKRGEGSGAPTGLLLKALVRLYPAKSKEALVTYLAGKDKTKQAALRNNPKIAAMIETIKAESAKTGGIDSEALLDELDEI